MNEIVYNIIGEPLDMNKTWYDNGLDDLDCVEFIMYIEKRLDIVIPDDVAGAFTRYNEKPKVFRSYLRNKKIEQLGL
jgi:acyl carrier protein